MLAKVADCVPALTPFGAKGYGTRPADVFFRMDSGETRTIACSNGAQQGDPMGPAMFCLALRPGLSVSGRNSREKEWKPSRTWTMSLSLGLMGMTPNTIRAFPSPGESCKASASRSTPPRPWLYHQKPHPDGGGDFAPRKRRCPRCRRRRGDGSCCPDRH